MADPNAKRDKALERQASALEDVSKTLRSLLRMQAVLTHHVTSLSEFIQVSQGSIDLALSTPSEAMQTETSRIPVRLMGDGNALIGWAEKDVGDDAIRFQLTSEWLVGHVESMKTSDQITGLFVGVESREAEDANAAE